MAGLTPEGFETKTVDEVRADIESDQRANLGESLNQQADSVLGQINGIVAAAIAELWEAFEQVYQSAYADTASGQSLSYISALTGVFRRDATLAEVKLNYFTADASATVPQGTRWYVEGDPDSVFETLEARTDFTGLVLAVPSRAINPGSATNAPDGSQVVWETPITGLVAATPTPGSFVQGRDIETDSELRIRREQTLGIAGSGTVDSMRAAVLQVRGVDQADVFEYTRDGNFEVLVYSAAAPTPVPEEIGQAIWNNKPLGTETVGQISTTVDDSSGTQRTVKYSEPEEVRHYVAVKITPDSSGTYPGNASAAQAVADWSRGLRVGQNAYASDIVNVCVDIQGVQSVDVSATFIDSTTPPTTTETDVSARQLITILNSDVTVTQ